MYSFGNKTVDKYNYNYKYDLRLIDWNITLALLSAKDNFLQKTLAETIQKRIPMSKVFTSKPVYLKLSKT